MIAHGDVAVNINTRKRKCTRYFVSCGKSQIRLEVDERWAKEGTPLPELCWEGTMGVRQEDHHFRYQFDK